MIHVIGEWASEDVQLGGRGGMGSVRSTIHLTVWLVQHAYSPRIEESLFWGAGWVVGPVLGLEGRSVLRLLFSLLP
jgi:hypothetical protein